MHHHHPVERQDSGVTCTVVVVLFFLSLSSKQHLFFYITRELTLMMHETEREMGTETASSLEPGGRRSRARAFNNYQNSRDGVSHFIPNLGRGGEPFSKFERGRGFTAIDFPINYQSHPSGICSTSPRVSDLLSFCTLAVLFFLWMKEGFSKRLLLPSIKKSFRAEQSTHAERCSQLIAVQTQKIAWRGVGAIINIYYANFPQWADRWVW